MKTSTDRTLTTHVGSLARPRNVLDLLWAKERGDDYDSFKTQLSDRLLLILKA